MNTQLPLDSISPDCVLTVSQLTFRIKDTLEEAFPTVWVCGEISNMARPQSGHVYLTLKDQRAQIRAVIWQSAARKIRFDLEDGLEVICRGELDVYPPRGSYQLVLRHIEPLGLGALELAFRQLQERLKNEGLFDAQWKKPLPRFPRRVAVVTSPSGAAIRDFLEVLRRRWPNIDVLVIPARVQGEGAAKEIAAGVAAANRLIPRPDVLVVTRGGGSLEDLWCFNEEIVVRAVFASEIPVISAVGHEIDVTLCDFTADVRALTPSEAAERVAPSADEIEALLANTRRRLTNMLRSRLDSAQSRLMHISQRRVFRKPLERIEELSRRVDEADLRLRRAILRNLRQEEERLAAAAAHLETLNPLAVLARGYSLTSRASDGALVRDAEALSPGEKIITRLAKGTITSVVE